MFYQYRDLETSLFEIILTMEGTTPETGNTIQVHCYTDTLVTV